MRAEQSQLGPDQGQVDLDLVRRVLAGEPAAGREYAQRMLCVPRILAVLNRRAGGPLDEGLLEDLTQEVLILIWEKLASFHGGAPLEAWAYRFCQLQTLNAVRRRARERHRLTELDEASTPGADELRTPVDEADGRLESPPHRRAPHGSGDDRFGLLYACIAELPDDERDIVERRLDGDVSFEEIGRRVGKPSTTVKSRYYRALGRLESLLKRRGGWIDLSGGNHG